MKYIFPDGRISNDGNTIASRLDGVKVPIEGIGKPFVEERPDELHYRVVGFTDEEMDGVVHRIYSIEPKETVEGLKQRLVRVVNRIAKNLLEETDWYVLRKVELSVEIPEYVTMIRAGIRSKAQKRIETISTISNYDSLVSAYPSLISRFEDEE